MEEHLNKRMRLLDSLKNILLKSHNPNETLIEKILIHRELLSNKEVILSKDFYSSLENKARAMPEMVSLLQKKEQIECVQINKKIFCPITQKEVVVPYVGQCGHTLEKKEAIKYLRNNPRGVCLHVGCNREFVRRG